MRNLNVFIWCLAFHFLSTNISAQNEFITVWNTELGGVSAANQLVFPGIGSNYNIAWETIDGSSTGVFQNLNSSLNNPVTLTFPQPGTYRLKALPGSGTFSGFSQEIIAPEKYDRAKLLKVEQWGSIVWTKLSSAFISCNALDITATDVPDLTSVTDLSNMFKYCQNLVGNNSFYNWNTMNVESMQSMFYGAKKFNQNIENWNVEGVANMAGMFSGAEVYNQPLNNWKTLNLKDISGIFSYAKTFNQPIAGWYTGKVTNMSFSFQGAAAFNQPLNSWDVKQVTNMAGMFNGTVKFNQPLDQWTTSNVTNMYYLFLGATSFDQNISTWEIPSIIDQDFGGIRMMLNQSGLSCDNFSKLLIGWAAFPSTPSSLWLGVGGKLFNSSALAAHNKLSINKGWRIGGSQYSHDCSTPVFTGNEFVTVWKSDNSGVTFSNQVNFPGIGTNYTIMWYNSQTATRGFVDNVTSSLNEPILIDFPFPGTYYVSAVNGKGSFTGFSQPYASQEIFDRDKLIAVEKWGNISWEILDDAFRGCRNMDVTATDVPDLSAVTNLNSMFEYCSGMKGNSSINNWDVSRVTSMKNMFSVAKTFNQPLDRWNVSNVTNMHAMFGNATSFNQPLESWNTSSVTDMSSMFWAATSFNQPLNNWNVSNVTDMYGMFGGAVGYDGAKSFNQPLNKWNTSKVRNMSKMFHNASSFNSYLGSWNLSGIVLDLNEYSGNLFDILTNSGMDCTNYSATLNGWALSSATPMGLTLGAVGRTYGSSAQEAHNTLSGQKGWTITGDTYDGSSVCGADLAPTFNIDNASFNEGDSRDLVVNLFEMNNTHTVASKITIVIAKPLSYDIKIPGIVLSSTPQRGVDGSSAVQGGTANNNSYFTFRETDTRIYVESLDGITLPPDSRTILGLEITRKPNTAPNTSQSITPVITTFSGGDTNVENNYVVLRISAN